MSTWDDEPGTAVSEQERSKCIAMINALRRGTVPALGLAELAVGLEAEEGVIQQQLVYVAGGGGDLKFIRGDYGAGKTFLIARALELAAEQGFVTAHVVISSETPLHRLKSLYQRICANMRLPTDGPALKTLIDTWLFGIEERVLAVRGPETPDEVLEAETVRAVEGALAGVSAENSALAAAVRTYYQANNRAEYPLAQAALGWIAGEPNVGRAFRQKAGIKGDVDETVALSFLRGLVSIICSAGYAGLAVAFDEVETTQGLVRAQREKGYGNLRQLVDGLDRGEMEHCYLLFTGTPTFFEGSRGIRSLPPLADRISLPASDGYRNPHQAQIVLAPFDAQKLEKVALRVVAIYAAACGPVDRERVSHRFIRGMIRSMTAKFGGRVDVIPRVFLREFVDALDKCALYPEYDPATSYQESRVPEDLREEEQAFVSMQF